MTAALVLLVTPTDRQGHAQRLRDAGFHVVSTSRAASTVPQIAGAGSAVIAIELVPSLTDETIAFADNLTRRRHRHTPLLVYGVLAGPAVRAEIENIGATWVDLSQGPPTLVEAVRGALAGSGSAGVPEAVPARL